MYNEWFSHMNKSLQNDISFSIKVQMAQEKNEFVSQFTCLQPHFYVKYKRWKYQ